MRKIIPVLATAALVSGGACADFLGVYVGYGNWKPDYSGSISNNSSDNLVVGSDSISIDEDNQTTFYFAFEHPIPFLPNVMIREQDMASQGAGTFTGTFGNQSFDGNITTEFDLSHRDYIIYYEMLDNWVNLDLGFTFRQFDGFVEVEGQSSLDPNIILTEQETVDFTLPMLYGKGRFDLPFTGLSLNVDLSYLSISGNTISDFSAYVGYESSIGLGIEGGIRTFSLDLDDEDDFTSNLEFDGVFINATFHF